jgi:Big-like domain-containing protein
MSSAAAVGTPMPNALAVKVTDAGGKPVPNAAVAFAVTQGNGSTNPRVANTNADGVATATWTLGTILGPNEVTASVTGVSDEVKFSVTGIPGPVNTISLSPQNPRLLAGTDSVKLTALSLDSFGNQTTPGPTFTVRDPTLVSVDASGMVHVLRRGAGTWIVATAGSKSDSVLVTVLAPGQSLCTAAATPVDLAIGQVATDVSGQGYCVHASSANAEYAIIPFYNSGVPSATITVDVRGQGLTSLPVPSSSLLPLLASPRAPQLPNRLERDDAFEARLRKRERDAHVGERLPRRGMLAPNRTVFGAATTVPAVGTLMKFNVNANDYCDNPDNRTGKVVAITNKAIIVADTANPAGGFTDAEYQSIGVTFDTLVDPVDRAAFGDVTDIDTNGHVIMFFTRAVNEMTTSGSSGVVLGFFYSRDLLPKSVSATQKCDGSNVAEMMYLLVPDTAGVVNGNKRTKAQVVTAANGTVAHEYEHMINAGRRYYVNGVGPNWEDRWLDEGLAHTAEELNFWRASGLSPRSNLTAAIYSDPKAQAAFSTFEANNHARYRTYLQRTELQAPVGFDSFDDDLQTRGAIWSFLRFSADHLPAGTENTFWNKLVNSTTSGVANLTNALGSTPYSLMRDWAISLYVDDNAANVDPRFQQPSWNMRSVLTNDGTSLAYPLTTRTLNNNSQSVLLAGNGASFLRFSVPAGQDALLTVTTGGQPLPSTVQLAVVRVR